MRKWLKSKESKKISSVIFFLCAVLIVQVISSFYFNKKLYDMSLEHAIQQVEELSEYVKKNFELELEHNIHILRNIELHFEKNGNMLSFKATELLKEALELSHFKMVGLSDLNGNGIDSNGVPHNISYP